MRIVNDHGRPVRSLTEWERLAPPTSPRHWRPYRSAYELARAWLEGDAAARLCAVLHACPALSGATLEQAVAERRTYFDNIPGGPRHHDLLVLARGQFGRGVIGIEAKADEPFDRRLVDHRIAALRTNAASRAPERLDRLTRALFGTTLEDDPTLQPLRYQLLSALAGTLAEARHLRAGVAVLVIHEFTTIRTDAGRRRRNAADLDVFTARLGKAERIPVNSREWIAGPYAIPGNTFLPSSIPIYIGKLATVVPGDRTQTLQPNNGHRMANPQKRTLPVDIPLGATLIKLNVHPHGCPCCASRGTRPFVINRPGRRGSSNLQQSHLDESLRAIFDLADDARRRPSGDEQNRRSTIGIGGGMTTITLAVDPGATHPFIAYLWDADERLATADLRAAIAQIERWATAARNGR